MTIAAVARIALTLATWSGVRSAELGGEGSSPLGPLLKILPLASARAASAACETPGASLRVVVLGKLQPVTASTSTVVAARSRINGFMLVPPVEERVRAAERPG